MKFYFAGAIRGGREKADEYGKIVKKLQEYGEVLSVHIADKNLSNKGEDNISVQEIYNRDVKWIEEADMLIAEVTVPSLGIGYELATAEKLGKKVICFFDNNSDKTLSAMIAGNEYFEIVKYNNTEEVLKYIDNLLN